MLHVPWGLGSPLRGMKLPGWDRDPAPADSADVGKSLGSLRNCFLPWASLFLGAEFESAVRFLAVVFLCCLAIRSNLRRLWRNNDTLRVKSSLQLEDIGFFEKKVFFLQTTLMLMTKFPYCNSNHLQRNLDQRIVVIPSSSYKKDARMGCPNTPSDD